MILRIQEAGKIPTGYWIVERDYMRGQSVVVLFPFNFIVTAWLWLRRLSWALQGKLVIPLDERSRLKEKAYRLGVADGADMERRKPYPKLDVYLREDLANELRMHGYLVLSPQQTEEFIDGFVKSDG